MSEELKWSTNTRQTHKTTIINCPKAGCILHIIVFAQMYLLFVVFPMWGKSLFQKGGYKFLADKDIVTSWEQGLNFAQKNSSGYDWGDHVMHFLKLDWNTSILYRIYITCAMKYAHYNPWYLFWILFLFTFKDGLSINFLVWLSHFVCIHIFRSEKSNIRTCSYVWLLGQSLLEPTSTPFYNSGAFTGFNSENTCYKINVNTLHFTFFISKATIISLVSPKLQIFFQEEKKLQVIHIKNTTNNSIKKVGRTLYISFIK